MGCGDAPNAPQNGCMLHRRRLLIASAAVLAAPLPLQAQQRA
jgi:hypothetical protein